MKPSIDPSSAEFFEAKYEHDPDPWQFAKNDYELHRYDETIKSLSGRRYRLAYEPGCSVGVLTERLADLCDNVEAIDFSSSAVAQAQARCAHLANVKVSCRSITEYQPDRSMDLLVLSELGYYFTPEEWQRTSNRLISLLPVGGTMIAVHWLGFSKDHRISGEQVHEVLKQSTLLQGEQTDRHESFLLDRWKRI
jgi:trans-aconitate methyltransferase